MALLSSPQSVVQKGYTLLGWYPGFTAGLTGTTGSMNTFLTNLGALRGTTYEMVNVGLPNSMSQPSTTLMNGLKNFPGVIMFTAPLCPFNGTAGSVDALLAGSYDSLIVQTFTTLISNGYFGPNIVIRLGWELQGNSFPWSINAGTGVTISKYIAGFRYYVNKARSVTATYQGVSQSFQGLWDCNGGTHSGGRLTPSQWWPGNDVADIVGVDMYNAISNPYTVDSNGNYQFGYGKNEWVTKSWPIEIKPALDEITQFAIAQNKLAGMGEFGMTIKPSSPYCSNGDQSYFKTMYNYITDPTTQGVWAYMCFYSQNQPYSPNGAQLDEEHQLYYSGGINSSPAQAIWQGPGTTSASTYFSSMRNTNDTGSSFTRTTSPHLNGVAISEYEQYFVAGNMQVDQAGSGGTGGTVTPTVILRAKTQPRIISQIVG